MTVSSDRPVSLDIGTSSDASFEARPDSALSAKPGPNHLPKRDADQEQQHEEDAAKLREFLRPEEAAPPMPSPHLHEQNTAALRPFDLFGSPVQTQTAPLVESPAIADLKADIVHLARRLMVGESVHGATVRVELASETLPGVVLEVFRDQGAIVAHFICANEHSRTRLARAVPWLGESLSRSLSQDTLIRVMTDDPEDPHPVETRNQAVSG
ncbi:hypothetical protein [Ottowia thiooxydans]|uniref:hypothetical protein n=1 Tax=Ottowia thiooxydans TaxID=219182 RepID=UPI0004147F91|nr:hypothetical protein [Ottowia thiooxydans]